MKQLEEYRRPWWANTHVAWLGIIFIAFCVAAAVYGIATVTSDGNAPIEYKTSKITYGLDSRYTSEGGLKKIYWRVQQDAVPRWKRFANVWHKIRYTYHYDRYGRDDAYMQDMYSIKEFVQIKDNYQTVDQIREYKAEQKRLYKKYNMKEIEKTKRRNSKKMWKEIQ